MKHPALLIAACFSLVIASCGTQEPILNSERIEQTFGSYGVDVLQANDKRRVSSLYSGTGDAKVTRTFAVVEFSDPGRRVYAREHSLVQSGQSLGAVFKSAGWNIEKISVFIGDMEIPADYELLSGLMQISLPATLATHVYELVVERDGNAYEYAMIVELHHPDYLSARDLEAIYGEIVFDDSGRNGIDDYIAPEIWKN